MPVALDDIEGLIDALGGTAAVAEAIGATLSNVANMRARGSIPVRYWERLLGCKRGQEINLSPDTLLALHRHLAPKTAPSKDEQKVSP